MKNAILLMMLFLPAISYAHGGGEVEAGKVGKGVIAFDEHEGFKLSPESIKRMQFGYKKVETAGSITISKEALVLALDETHVYTHINDYFKAIDVKIISKTKDSYSVSATGLKTGVEVVTKGVSFLRVIDMDMNASEEEGEHHD